MPLSGRRGRTFASIGAKSQTDPGAAPGDAANQTRRALANVAAILEAGGSGLDQVLQMTVYVSDIDHWPTVNEIYAEVMGDHRPARAVVPVRDLHHGYLVEIQAIAAVQSEEVL